MAYNPYGSPIIFTIITIMGLIHSVNVNIPLPDNARHDNTDHVAKTILSGPKNPIIAGSYVYKRMIRGETVDDVDATSDDIWRTSQWLQSNHGARPKILGNYEYEEPFEDYTALELDNTRIDLIGKGEFNEKNKQDTFINTMVLTKRGLEHRRDVDTKWWMPRTYGEKAKFDQKQTHYVIENLQKGRYCKWDDMRDKDEEYFKKFNEIPERECEIYGFFRQNKNPITVDADL